MNNKNFAAISSYLLSGSVAEKELKDYVDDLKETDYDYDFQSNEVGSVNTNNDGTVQVITREWFVFTNHVDKQTDYDRRKTYTIKVSGDDYKIKSIDYDDTKRD